MDFEAATRASYDDVLSVDHLHRVSPPLAERPFDRALLQAFADVVPREPAAPVADVGCGAGHLTAYLAGQGLDAFGVDLSPGMLAVARAGYPGLRFELGSMLALDLPDASLAGLVSSYSLIHVPWEERPRALAGFRRVLRPGGALLIAFQVGDDRVHRTQVDGRAIDVSWYRQQPGDLAELLRAADFDPIFQGVRAASASDSTPQGYLLATAGQPQEGQGGGLEHQ